MSIFSLPFCDWCPHRGRLDPPQVVYLEAGAAGFPELDAAEVAAAADVLACNTPSAAGNTPLLAGSVKASVGHTGGAAGLAGLLKAVLVLRAGGAPPQRQ
eukprot:1423444-Pyramimonas_sp.AAC.1